MSHEPAKILLVDDRPDNLLALEAILEPLNLQLIRAYSGADALRSLLQHDFAVILLDVQMPGINGFETAELIKSRERSRHIPIIFLTAISKEDQYVFRGYSVGAVDYMFKPLQPDVLRSKVQVFVDLHEKTEQIREQEKRLNEARQREMEQRYALERMESEARFSDVLAAATEAIIGFDEHNRITLFNAGAEKIFDIRATRVVDTSVLDLLHTSSRSEFARAVSQASLPGARSASDQTIVVSALRSSGERFPLECSISSLRLRELRTFTLIGRDITQRLQAEHALRVQAEQLSQATEELQAVNDELSSRQEELERAIGARSRFYASMSHELRTPINAVLGYSSLMLEGIYGPLNEDQIEGIERTKRAANHLLELVNDVLDLSKIEAGKVELQMETVTFPDLIEDLFITVRPLAEQSGSELVLARDGEPVKIVTDPRRLRQILLNLLSNAIKFGSGKPVQVRCTRPPHGGVSVEVTDQGEGIAAEEQEAIFDEFVQLGKNRTQEGTGLGLPISRRLAQLLNGSLEVHSEIGRGSTFTLTLPAVMDGPSPELTRLAQKQPAPL